MHQRRRLIPLTAAVALFAVPAAAHAAPTVSVDGDTITIDATAENADLTLSGYSDLSVYDNATGAYLTPTAGTTSLGLKAPFKKYTVVVNTGAGDDIVRLASNIGSGDDSATVSITTGDGSDSVQLDTGNPNVSVDVGAGADVITGASRGDKLTGDASDSVWRASGETLALPSLNGIPVKNLRSDRIAPGATLSNSADAPAILSTSSDPGVSNTRDLRFTAKLHKSAAYSKGTFQVRLDSTAWRDTPEAVKFTAGDGLHRVKIRLRAADGTISPLSTTYYFALDYTAPAAPTLISIEPRTEDLRQQALYIGNVDTSSRLWVEINGLRRIPVTTVQDGLGVVGVSVGKGNITARIFHTDDAGNESAAVISTWKVAGDYKQMAPKSPSVLRAGKRGVVTVTNNMKGSVKLTTVDAKTGQTVTIGSGSSKVKGKVNVKLNPTGKRRLAKAKKLSVKVVFAGSGYEPVAKAATLRK